jgi:hypothetical protein
VGENDYAVECLAGGRYRISETSEGRLGLVDLLADVVRAGGEGLVQILRVPMHLLKLGGAVGAQSAEVVRGLFAIVSLSGLECAGIDGVVRRDTDDHVVTCQDGEQYHIYTGTDGLVAVEPL